MFKISLIYHFLVEPMQLLKNVNTKIIFYLKQRSTLSQNVTKIFAKETLSSQQISSGNILKTLGVYENPISNIMRHLEFSFVQLGGDIAVNSLDHLLDMLDK